MLSNFGKALGSELPGPAGCAKVSCMEVLGRRLPDPFDAFWEQYGPEIPASVEHIEEGHSSVFGDLGADRSAPEEPAWAGLPDDDLAYHIAHELAHLLLRARSYPVASPGTDVPSGSEAARVAGDLQEMIDHAALSEILASFGFRNDFILARTAGGASRGLASSPVPEPGTAWFATWAIRYCDLARDLGPERWAPIKAVYRERAPDAADLGERIIAIVEARGCGSPGKALWAMLQAREALDIDPQVVRVIDPAGGVY